MVDQFISTVVADNSIGMSALYIAVAGLVLIFGLVFGVICLTNYKHRADTSAWYEDKVVAFKAGFINDKAKNMNIDLEYPPKADLGKALEEQVSKDLNTL